MSKIVPYSCPVFSRATLCLNKYYQIDDKCHSHDETYVKSRTEVNNITKSRHFQNITELHLTSIM
jgi:hypothetical protein